MEKEDWDRIASRFTDQVFQITDHDTRNVIRSHIRRLGGSAEPLWTAGSRYPTEAPGAADRMSA